MCLGKNTIAIVCLLLIITGFISIDVDFNPCPCNNRNSVCG
jgi:hypothetical protein